MTGRSDQTDRPVVLVTGATGGIGSAVALAWAQRGAHVVLLARSGRALRALAERCAEQGGSAQVVVADVPADVFDRTVTVGVLGPAAVARAVLPVLAEQRAGSLVVVGSVLGQVAVPFMSGYVTAKWAVRGLTRVLQIEARATPGVHVALVSPGAIDTAIYQLAANHAGRVGRPPPPVYPPERVAEAVLRVVDGRRRSASVGAANPLMRLGFSAAPWLFDRLVTPLMRVAGLSRSPVAPHSGNLFVPSEQVHAPRYSGSTS